VLFSVLSYYSSGETTQAQGDEDQSPHENEEDNPRKKAW